jgi:hypothetical protein
MITQVKERFQWRTLKAQLNIKLSLCLTNYAMMAYGGLDI